MLLGDKEARWADGTFQWATTFRIDDKARPGFKMIVCGKCVPTNQTSDMRRSAGVYTCECCGEPHGTPAAHERGQQLLAELMMNPLKQAQESGEDVVIVGATGRGTVTSIDSLTKLMELAKHGHPGMRILFAASDIEQFREIPANVDAVLSNCNVKIFTCRDS